MDFRFFAAAGGIALLDIVLSGDNALVIAAAANRLPRAKRMLALIWGGVLAAVIRIALAAAATVLLLTPYLRLVGGILLVFVAIHVLMPSDDDTAGTTRVRRGGGMLAAMFTIVIADATMSLDNVLAVAALAAGNVLLLVAGLVVSILFLFVASAIISRVMDLAPWLLDLAALVIAWTASGLIASDHVVTQLATGWPRWWEMALRAGLLALVLVADLIIRLRAKRSPHDVERDHQTDTVQVRTRADERGGARRDDIHQ